MKFLPALAAFLICFTGKTPSAAVPGKALPRNPPAAGEPLEANAPLNFKKGIASLASMRADDLKWFGTWLLPELSRTWEGEPWKDRAVAFVKERVHRFHYDFPSENTASPMVEQASLLNFGCRDPWVRLLGAWELESENAEEDYAKMWQAFTEIRDSPTDPALKRFAALPLLMEEKDLPRPGEWSERLARVHELFDDWTVGLGKSPCYQGKDANQLLTHLKALPKIDFNHEKLVPRLALQKEFPEWLLNILQGELELDLAWKKRGSGFAADVTPEGWEGFTQHLAEARKHLTAAWRARPDQSRSAGLMITVAMAGDTNGNETPRLWFDRATESTVDSGSAFINYRRSLLPRWGGSYRAMMDFATQCVKSKRFDTRVPEALTDVLEDIAAEQMDSRATYRMPGVPALVREMNEGYLAAADTAQHRADRFALLMVDSWLSGDSRTAYEMLEAFGLPMSSAAQHRIEKLSVSWNQLLAEVVLYGGPGGDIARQADALEQSGKPEEALPLWQQWQTLTKPQPWVKTQGAVRLRAAERRRDYANGNWVELPVDGPGDWDRPLGTWELDGKAGLVAVGDGESVAYTAVYPLSTGPHFECRTKFRITGTPVQPNSQDPYIQIHTGFKPWSFYAATTATLAMDMGAKSISAYLSQNSATEPASDTVDLAVDPGGEIELLFRRTDQGLTLTVNGKPVLKNWEETPGDPDFEKGYFALGAQGLQVGTKLTILSTALHRLP